MQRFFCKTSNHPGDSVPLQPRFGTLRLLAFHRTKITFEREKISDHRWDSGKYDRAAEGNWENCVRSQGAYFEGDWGSSSYVQCFFNEHFYSVWLDTFWTDLVFIAYRGLAYTQSPRPKKLSRQYSHYGFDWLHCLCSYFSDSVVCEATYPSASGIYHFGLVEFSWSTIYAHSTIIGVSSS